MVRKEIVLRWVDFYCNGSRFVFYKLVSLRMRNSAFSLIAPLHHHYEKQGWEGNKVVIRFGLLPFFLVVLELNDQKLR